MKSAEHLLWDIHMDTGWKRAEFNTWCTMFSGFAKTMRAYMEEVNRVVQEAAKKWEPLVRHMQEVAERLDDSNSRY